MSGITKRYEAVLLFDVRDGNPNGDPDNDNLPRQDEATGQGLVTDVCLKRKLRDYVDLVKGGTPGYDIFIRDKVVLNDLIAAGYAKANSDEEASGKPKKGKKAPSESGQSKARRTMCEDYFDVRAFGAVMSTGGEKNAGQVRGPVQISFARSIDPIEVTSHLVHRMAVTNEKDEEKESTFGTKHTVPYGLYRAHIFISPHLANPELTKQQIGTGFNQEDLDLLWAGLRQMFEFDRAAARGVMTTQKLIIFEHDSPLGNANAADLFKLVEVRKKDGVDKPRDFSDYEVKIGTPPAGVRIL